jgi:Mn2+/Fe2+ NRAMP family transporter
MTAPDHPTTVGPPPGAVTSPARRKGMSLRRFLSILGPGLITGAADDDPSGIATYSQTGAQFGFGQLWTAFWMLPMVIAVQEACGRIGSVTGRGLSANIKSRYGPHVLRGIAVLLTLANTINIGADLGAMGESAALVIHIKPWILMVAFAAVILAAEINISYRRYSRVLKWLTVSVLAYAVTAFLVHAPWGTVLRATFVPHISFDSTFLYVITAVIGTTISPYMFFWQTSQEVEESRGRGGRRPLADLRTDNAVGMIASQLTAWFIIVVTGDVLHAAGVTTVRSAADAAKALVPLVHGFPYAGEFAQGLFALGVVSLGLLAVPVLTGSTSYALAEARGKPEGLDLKPREGRYFYSVIATSVIIGLLLNLLGVDPFKALVFAAVFNGVAAVPLIWIIGRIAADPAVMGAAKSGPLSRAVVGVTFIGMAASVVLLAVSYLK